jgi:hypothetical protein
MRILRLSSICLLVIVLLTFALPASPAVAWGERWCSGRLDARDLGGGTFWNRNYVVEFRVPFYPGDDARIYYNGQRQYLVYHGYIDRANRWGVSTWWAYRNPGWLDDSRWRIEFRCIET